VPDKCRPTRSVPRCSAAPFLRWTAASRRAQLADIVALQKRFRHGVVATDRVEALLAVTRLTSGTTHHTAPILVPGLDDATPYELSIVVEVRERAVGMGDG
jgi:hypothetical protein